MNLNRREQDEQWIAQLRKRLQESEEPLPDNGWARLEADLSASDRRRRTFTVAWKKIAAVAAVVAIAVLIIGETVVNQGVVDGNRTFLADNSATADGQLTLESPETSNDRLTEKVISALSESGQVVAPALAASSDRNRTSDNSQSPVSANRFAEAKRAYSDEQTQPRRMTLPANDLSAESEKTESAVGQDGRDKDEDNAPQQRATTDTTSPTRSEAKTTRQSGLMAFNDVALRQTGGTKTRRTSMGIYAAGLPTARQSISGHATPIAFNGGYSLNAVSGILRVERSYDDYLYNHKQPLSFGFSIRKELGHRLSLETGLVYSLLRSDVRVSTDNESFSQTLHMLGIPLRVNWDFLARSNWKLYVGAGGMAETAVYAKFGSEQVSEKGLQWSLMAVGGVQYDFTPHAALYFEPGVSYYLTETELHTARTESPVNLSLQLGVRLTY